MVHLAAGKIPRYGDALDTLVTNGEGGLGVLRACVACGVRRMVLASTSDCYGRNPDVPVLRGKRLGDRLAPRPALELRDLEDVRGAGPLRVSRAPRPGGRGPPALRRLRPAPEPHLVGRPAVGLHRRRPARARSWSSTAPASRRAASPTWTDMVEGFVRAVDVAAADGEMLNIGNDREISDRRPGPHDLGPGPGRRAAPQAGPPEDLRPLRGRGAAHPGQPARRPRCSGYTPTRAPRGGAAPHDRLAAGGHGAGRDSVIHVVVPAYNEAGNVDGTARGDRASASSLSACATASSWSTTGPPTAPREACRRASTAAACPSRSSADRETGGPGRPSGAASCTCSRGRPPPRPRRDAGRRPHQRPARPAAHAAPRVGGGRSHRARLLLPLRRRHPRHEPAPGGPQPRRQRPHEEGPGPVGVSDAEQLLSRLPGLGAQGPAARYGDGFITTRGFECMVEILYRAARLGLRISEVPMVLDGSRRVGKSKMKVLRTSLAYFRLMGRAMLGRALGGGAHSGATTSTKRLAPTRNSSPSCELPAVDPLRTHEGPVGADQIAQDHALPVALDGGVLAGDVGVVQLQLRAASSPALPISSRARPERERLALPGAGDGPEGHALALGQGQVEAADRGRCGLFDRGRSAGGRESFPRRCAPRRSGSR